MIWGMTLHPGVEYIREVTGEEYLTLASLDCRPQMNTEVYHPMAHLVVRVNNCEHVLCFLEKGLVHQQGLDFVFQEGDNLKLAVEGSGVVHITGYSVRHTMYEDNQDDRSVSSPVSAVPDGIQDDMKPPTLSFMGQPKINESSLLEGRFRQSSVKVERGEKSDQSTRDQILYQDMNHEMTGGTFTYQNSIQVDSTLQKDTEMINQLQGANERVVDLENGHLQEMLPQITNIRTETFCTEDWNIEVEESCVESHLETNGEAMHHLGEATLTTISEHQSNHSMNMSEEDTDNISHGDLSDEYSGEMTLYGTTDRGCLETQVHCSSNKDIFVSSDVTLSFDKQPVVLIPNLSIDDWEEDKILRGEEDREDREDEDDEMSEGEKEEDKDSECVEDREEKEYVEVGEEGGLEEKGLVEDGKQKGLEETVDEGDVANGEEGLEVEGLMDGVEYREGGLLEEAVSKGVVKIEEGRSDEYENNIKGNSARVSEAPPNGMPKRRKPYRIEQGLMRRQCILCGKVLVRLANHLQDVHKIHERVKRKEILYEARVKVPIQRNGRSQTKRKLKDCPVTGCVAKGLRRIDVHLSFVHHLKRNSENYKIMLQRAPMTRVDT